MPDAPDATPHAHSPHSGGDSGFWSKEVAGLPNWVWLIVIAGGIAAVYIVPKFFGSSGTSSQTSTTSGGNPSGLGLAIDPTTGLPYAVEGLVPAGGQAGGTNVDLTQTNNLLQELLNLQTAANQQPPASSTGTSSSGGGIVPNRGANPPPNPTSGGQLFNPPAPPNPPTHSPLPAQRTYTVQKWPSQGSTLWGIAQQEYGNGALYPLIQHANVGRYPSLATNPNLIQPGWTLVIPNQ